MMCSVPQQLMMCSVSQRQAKASPMARVSTIHPYTHTYVPYYAAFAAYILLHQLAQRESHRPNFHIAKWLTSPCPGSIVQNIIAPGTSSSAGVTNEAATYSVSSALAACDGTFDSFIFNQPGLSSLNWSTVLVIGGRRAQQRYSSLHLGEAVRASLARVTELCGAAFLAAKSILFYPQQRQETFQALAG